MLLDAKDELETAPWALFVGGCHSSHGFMGVFRARCDTGYLRVSFIWPLAR